MFSEHVRGRDAARAATRHRVLAAARRRFDQQGHGATTVRQIAADAEVSTGTVMSVGDKDGLLVAVFDEAVAAVHRDRHAVVGTGGPLTRDEAVEAVLGLVQPFLAHFADHPALSRTYASIIVRGTHDSAIFRELAATLIDEVRSTLVRTGIADLVAVRSARTIYFAYLGILMSTDDATTIEHSASDLLADAIRCVLDPAGAGTAWPSDATRTEALT